MQLIDWQYTLIPTNYSIKLKGDFYKFVNIFQWKFWLQLNNCNWLIFNYCVQSWPCRFHTRSRSIGVTFERLCLENAKTQCHGLSHVLCCPDRTCTEPTFAGSPVVCSAKVRIHCRLAGVAFGVTRLLSFKRVAFCFKFATVGTTFRCNQYHFEAGCGPVESYWKGVNFWWGVTTFHLRAL